MITTTIIIIINKKQYQIIIYLSGFYLYLKAIADIRKIDALFICSFTLNLKTFVSIFVVNNHSIHLWIKSLPESLRTEISLSEKEFQCFYQWTEVFWLVCWFCYFLFLLTCLVFLKCFQLVYGPCKNHSF